MNDLVYFKKLCPMNIRFLEICMRFWNPNTSLCSAIAQKNLFYFTMKDTNM